MPVSISPGFGVYIHWPFCASKCPYCDFNSYVIEDPDPDHWSRALVAELDHYARQTPGHMVTSVFFGGGTPSLMAPRVVEAVLERIARRWPLAPDVEISLEANPTSVEAENFFDLASVGVDRLSLGVQALDDQALRALGRNHTVAEALAALDVARAHFPRASFDLIYARPGQSPDGWAGELDAALVLGPDHLSLYQLTIEPKTPFHALEARGDLVLPMEDNAARMYELTQELCEAAGLPAYEISNHARPGEECRHNMTYWRMGEYLGIGPGAHGRVKVDGVPHATVAHAAPGDWLQAVANEGCGARSTDPLSIEEQVSEFLLMGLRTREGVDLPRLTKLAGRPWRDCMSAPGRAQLLEEGFLSEEGERLVVTPRGRPLLNGVLARLLF